MREYRIAIVENDEDERAFMQEGFADCGGFDIVGMFSNGDKLFDWLKSHNATLPELVLSDLNMPGSNGYDIISTLKHTPEWSHIPVVITSTSYTQSIIDKCLALGAADYIIKPDTFIEYKQYADTLYRCIEEKHLVG